MTSSMQTDIDKSVTLHPLDCLTQDCYQDYLYTRSPDSMRNHMRGPTHNLQITNPQTHCQAYVLNQLTA